MFNTENIIKIITNLGSLLKDIFLGIFFYVKGKDSEKLRQARKELEDVKKADKLRDHISSLSDDDLDSGL